MNPEEGMPVIDTEIKERDRFIFDLVDKRNDAEFERSNLLDVKASSIIGFVGIIIGLLGTILAFVLDKIYINPKLFAYYSSYRVILFLGIVFLALAIFCSLMAYFIRQYTIVPDTKHLIEEYAMRDRDLLSILRIVAQERSDAILKNSVTVDDKSNWIKYSQILFGLGMGLAILFICGLLII